MFLDHRIVTNLHCSIYPKDSSNIAISLIQSALTFDLTQSVQVQNRVQESGFCACAHISYSTIPTIQPYLFYFLNTISDVYITQFVEAPISHTEHSISNNNIRDTIPH